jgi:uncharacterized protein (DUF111 family)
MPNPGNNTYRINLRLTRECHEDYKEIAKKRGVPVAQVYREMLDLFRKKIALCLKK